MDPNTMQALSATAQAIHQLDGTQLSSLLMTLALGAIGFLGGSVAGQHLIEAFIAKVQPPFWVKVLLPSALSSIFGLILNYMGCTMAQATEAAIGLSGLIHAVNETGLASCLETKLKAKLAGPAGQVSGAVEPVGGSQAGPKALGLLLGLLLIGSALSAAPVSGWCAGPALWAGSTLYQTDGGSTLAPEQSALGGVEFAGYLGSWDGSLFAPTYTLGVLGAMRTQGSQNSPCVGITGGFYLQGVPMTIFCAKDLSQGSGGLLWGVGTNVQFSGWVPFLYLGQPGN